MAAKRYLRRVFEESEVENRRQILERVRSYAPRPRLLDLGCYDGRFTVELARAAEASEVSGVEFLAEHGTKARSLGVDVTVADLSEPLPLESDAYDLVHANQVIEHVRWTDLFLGEASRVARPGAPVIVSTNNLASWHNIVSLALGFQPFPAHVSDEVHVGNPLSFRDGLPHEDAGQTHVRIFTGRALAELGRHHGLELEEMAASGFYPFRPPLARRLSKLDGRHAAFLIAVFRAR